MKFLLLLHLIHALFVGCWVSRCSWELLQDSSFQLCHSTSHEEGLGLFSWVTVLHGQELGGELGKDNIHRYIDLKELEKTLGEERVHFIIS